jgi:hypothetical protein
MRKSHTSKIIVLGALCCAFSTACSGGGGGGISQSVTASANTATAASTSTTVSTGPAPSDTGIAGTVAAPAAATFGTAPSQLATSGGRSFEFIAPNFSNVTFPLIISGLQKTSAGLSPTPSDPAATLTVVSYSCNPCTSTEQLVIPSLGVNQTISENNVFTNDESNYFYGLDYAVMGFWKQAPSANSPNVFSDSEFVFGYETPQAAMPTSGTAVFSTGLAQADVYKTVGTEIQTTTVDTSSVSITANFGSGAVTGSFTNMQTSNNQTWNNMALTANIATGTNKFSGSTAATSAPGLPMSLSGSATGSINGAFYGPAAQNLGAVWSLSDGTGSAIGTVVAGH